MALSNAADIRRAGLMLVTASATVALLAGCTSGSEKKAEPTPSASPSASADPQAAAKAEVAAVYRSYWDAQIAAFAKADVRDTGLEKYAFDQAYSKTLADVVTMKVNGSVMTGKPQITPEVTAVSLDQDPKKASISDCVDVTNWKVVDPKTGKEFPLPPERLKRFVTKFEARTVGSEWKIVSVEQQDRTC